MMRHVSRPQLLVAALGLIGAVTLIALIAGAPHSASTPSAASSNLPVVTQPALAGKILVASEGMIEVKLSDLKTIGWTKIDPTQIRVDAEPARGGHEQPVWVHDDALVFYAQVSPTRYMTQSMYALKIGAPTIKITDTPPVPAAGLVSVDHYTATVRAEQNRVYMPQVEEGDHWFWVQLPAPQTKTFTVTLSDMVSGPARMHIEVWASTEGPSSPDHHYRIAINDQPLADEAIPSFWWDESWDGTGRHSIDFDVPVGVLRSGQNFVKVEAPGDTGVTADTTFVDWIEVKFPRRFVAEDDQLIFESPGGQHQLIGVSGPIEVFDVTQPDRVTRLALDSSATMIGEVGHRYVAVGPQGYRSGQVMAAALEPDLQAIRAIDYIAIGPRDLLEPLQPLLDYHTAQGLKTLAVPVEAIYDQFGDGRIDPEAIRSFLIASRPKYVLLVGGASYDTLGYIAPAEANRVPTFFVQTVHGGETASDVGFVQWTDDAQPDAAIGRIPAREPLQVKTFVEKTLAYLQAAPAGDWRRRVLAVADGQDPSFRDEAQAFLDPFKADFQTTLVSPPANTPDADQAVLKDWNEGTVLVSYFGHGSLTQWGKDHLFTVEDSAALKNGGRLPIVLNMTCLTGLFTHPKVQSLAETLLWMPDGGAVAVLAPTSLTLTTDQSYLSTAFGAAYLKDPSARLGDWVLAAWRAVPTDSPGGLDVLRTFLLFGDPALRVAR